MPQFAYSARDSRGNAVEGTLVADDLNRASEQVTSMGFTLLRMQPLIVSADMPPPILPNAAPAPRMGLPTASVGAGNSVPTQTQAYNAGPPPVDLSLPVTEMPAHLGPVLLNEESDSRNIPYLEPWQRGGALEQPAAAQMTLTETGHMVANTTSTQAQVLPILPIASNQSPTDQSRLNQHYPVNLPYGAGVERSVPFLQRAKEVLIYPIFAGVVVKDLAQFYRQFATLINAGLPLYQALSALESNTVNAKLKEIAREGQRQVQAGGRFSDVMAAYPWIFQELQIEMVRASEMGGMLDNVLLEIATYVENELELRRMIRRETMYPKLVLFCALMILGNSGLGFGSLGMPAISALVVGKIDLMGYLAETLGFGLMVATPIAIAAAVFRLFLFNISGVREAYDYVKLRIPALGGIVRIFATAKFARTFAFLYRGGFTMGTALDIAGNASGNAVIRRAAHKAVYAAEHGELVSDQLRATNTFPTMALDMMRTGETSGNLDQMLDKVADYFESEGKTKAHTGAIILGVVVFLIVAVIVAGSIIGFYTGMGAGISEQMNK